MGEVLEGSQHEDRIGALNLSLDRTSRTAIYAILIASVLVKLVLIWHLDGRMYFDNSKAVNFGFLVHRGWFSIHTDVVNSKTFVGPLLWYHVFDWFGATGLKLVNLLAFVLLFVTVYRLGAPRFPKSIVLLGLFLFAFYAGTNRNVAAGEPDDHVAALLFGLGVLAYLNNRNRFLAGLIMGAGFLFKFWVAVFCIGLGLFLLWKRRWRDAMLVTIGAVVPFAIVNGIDGFESFRSLLVSERMQNQLSPWTDMAARIVSTGMLFTVVASAWSWFRDKSDVKTLFFLLLVIYVVYVLFNRDAFAITFVMMQCLMFCTFLVADAVLALTNWRRLPLRGRPALVAFCSLYLVATTAIAWQHLYRDTVVVELVQTQHQVEEMFWFRILQ